MARYEVEQPDPSGIVGSVGDREWRTPEQDEIVFLSGYQTPQRMESRRDNMVENQ
jgi:hypothetical protein